MKFSLTDFYTEHANYTRDFEQINRVRQTVFIEEQHIPADIEFDQLDSKSHHVLVRDLEFQPVGTGRLLPTGKIGRMAVLPEWRNQGVGASIIRALCEKARQLGLTEVTAHAQITALDFYLKQGFKAEGPIFLEVSIPHRAIRLELSELRQTKLDRIKLDVRPASIEPTRLATVEATHDAALNLVQNASRAVCILTRDLELGVYGQITINNALKTLALSHRNSLIQIIMQEPALARNPPNLLINLAQRLPSNFMIRATLGAEDFQYPSAFMINDSDGYLFRQQQARYQGHWSTRYPTRNRQLKDTFDRIWQRSVPCGEFRALSL